MVSVYGTLWVIMFQLCVFQDPCKVNTEAYNDVPAFTALEAEGKLIICIRQPTNIGRLLSIGECYVTRNRSPNVWTCRFPWQADVILLEEN